MELTTTIDGSHATIALMGNMTVATAPGLEKAFAALPDEVDDVTLDLTDLNYVASAGLRVIVSGNKALTAKGGTMRLVHPVEEVMEVFDVTGLVEILTIEP